MAKPRKPQALVQPLQVVIPETRIECYMPEHVVCLVLSRALAQDDVLAVLDWQTRGKAFRFSSQKHKILLGKGISEQMIALLEEIQPLLTSRIVDPDDLFRIHDAATAKSLIHSMEWGAWSASFGALAVELLLKDLELPEDDLGLRHVLPLLKSPLLYPELAANMQEARRLVAQEEAREQERAQRHEQEETKRWIQLLESKGYTVIAPPATETTPAPVFKKAAKPRKSSKK